MSYAPKGDIQRHPAAIAPQKNLVNFNKSSLEVNRQTTSTIILELKLQDTKGGPLATNQTPEIVFDGNNRIVSPMKKVAPGRWQIEIMKPSTNQIIYFGARANGQTKDHWLRFQHVEQ